MMNKIRNKKAGCHCEENISSTKQSSTPVSNQCFDYMCTIGRKVEDCRVGVSHLLAMTRIGRSLEFFRFLRKNRDDIIYFKAAEILGSCFASPRMTEKRRCPRMTFSILTLAAVLSTGIISESWAGCEGCEGECIFKGCDYECTACKEGYELSSTCWFKTCTPKCQDGQERISGTCTRKCTANEDRYNGVCVDKCATDELRATTGTCVKSPACSGGSFCRNLDGLYVENCCYKIEGDTTTLYPNDSTQGYDLSEITLGSSKNLVIESGATNIYGAFFGNFEDVYIGENSSMNTSCWCCNNFTNTKHIMIPESGVQNFGSNCYNSLRKEIDIVCLGDVETCKQYTTGMKNNVVAPTESQCNGSKSYYYTGSECEKRPENGTDITCDHEISGYIKVGNYCASPEVTYAKKRYTPAEAAQWLKDEDNEITITFKK